MRQTAAVLAVTLLAAGCTGGTPEPRQDTGIDPSPQAATPSGLPGSSPTSSRSPDVPPPVEVDRPGDLGAQVVRAGDGTTLVLSNAGSKRTTYRVYGPAWRPRSPLLAVPGELHPLRGLDHAFIGELTRYGIGRSRHWWVMIGQDGVMRSVQRTLHRGELAPGDELISPIRSGVMAFRPSSPQIWRPTMPAGSPPSRRMAAPDDSGGLCLPDFEWKSSGSTYASPDGGHTWRRLDLKQLLPRSAEPYVASCRLRGSRLIVVTGKDMEAFNTIHIIDLKRPARVRSHRVGNGYGPLLLGVLGSGRTVWSMSGQRPVVATDSTNRTFATINLKVPRYAFPQIAGSHMIYQRPHHHLSVSTDAGRSWSTVDLKAGSWSDGP